MFVLADKKGKYVTYNQPETNNLKFQSCAVMYTDSISHAYQYTSFQQANAEKKRLSKKARDFEVVETKAPIKNKCSQNTEILNGNSKRCCLGHEIRREVYRKTEGRCYLCGEFVDYDSFEVEHIVPLASGGTNDVSNLMCSCHMCNRMKGCFGLSDFLAQAEKIAAAHAGSEYNGKRISASTV